ncbi:MAG: BREX system Lon protease-like protein BrxL [Thermoproteota archaeon]|nr:MAG: BREX system Lon protease-like protein BrxL [Candidatus Korarchaeota archaeon]
MLPREKLIKAFGRDTVVKKGMLLSLGVWKIPQYIGEYLVIRECKDTPDDLCSEKVSKLLRELRPEPADRDLALNRLMTEGELTIIDFIKVTTDIKRGVHDARIPSLALRRAMIRPELLEEHEELLRNGVWALLSLRYSPGRPLGDEKSDPILVEQAIPYQVTGITLEAFYSARKQFTDEEWIDLLAATTGLNPQAYTQEQKLLLLARLAPLAEANLNIMELGPRATGKTHLYRNISPYSRVIAGGKVSPAQLFYHKVYRTPGLIATMDLIAFDEITYLKFTDPDETLAKLKDYMASGHYERGEKQEASGCSLAFLGNVDVKVESGRDLTLALPHFARDPAFMDRIHLLIPGWKLPKVSQKHLYTGEALALDYLAAVLHQLRKVDLTAKASSLVKYETKPSIRDQQAITRALSALLKLVYPGQKPGPLTPHLLQAVTEMRRTVREWLAQVLPHEYTPQLKTKLAQQP